MLSVGYPLLDLARRPTPYELLRTILHCMIDHFVLYEKGAVLGDVSATNIRRLSKPVSPGYVTVLDYGSNATECWGVLLDFDPVAQRVGGEHGPYAIRNMTSLHPGALPFLSIRLLVARRTVQPTIHTAADGLESFLWLLMSSIASILLRCNKWSPFTVSLDSLLDSLKSSNLERRLVGSWMALDRWEDPIFTDLVRRWGAIARMVRCEVGEYIAAVQDAGKEEMEKVQKDMLRFCKGLYEQYLNAGFTALQALNPGTMWC